MMTKKDYERAASLIARYHAGEYEEYERGQESPEMHDAMILERAFVEFFTGDNPRFDAVRFIERARVQPKTRGSR